MPTLDTALRARALRPAPLSPALGAALFASWLATAAAGVTALGVHVATAARAPRVAAAWPAGSAIGRASDRPTLVCFVHPRCPCTRATLRELERVLARGPGAAVRVVFRDDPDGALEAAPSWSLAARLPGARRLRDPGGREAARFGAGTSGLVLLYDAGGELRFRGGVTGGRGHEGPNDGADALTAALRGRGAASLAARVFGCELGAR